MRYSIILLVLINLSCSKQVNYENSFIKVDEYSGLTKGRFIVYDVKEINHTPATATTVISDTLHYELKVVIEDTLYDNLGRLSWKYSRFKRNSSSESWVQTDVWTSYVDRNNFELVEENQRIIKMKSPIKNSTNWDANIYTNLGSTNYSYLNINNSFTFNNLFFDSTVTIDQEDLRNLIDYRKKMEIYAKGVGMVYKYYKDLDIANFDTLNIKSGKELYLFPKLIGFQ